MKIKHFTQSLFLFLLTSSSAHGQYCSPTLTAPPVSTWGIEAVQFSNLAKTSGVGGYSDFTSDIANITLGSTNTIVIANAGSPQLGKTVWIDWNMDDSLDSTERYVFDDFTNSFDIPTPSSATIGTTRMRVALTEYGATNTDACSSPLYEVEDYTVIISDGSNVGLTEENQASSPFKIYPNPAHDAINIQWNGDDLNSALHITNSRGQMVMILERQGSEQSIDCSQLNPGVYFVITESNPGSTPTKLIIK